MNTIIEVLMRYITWCMTMNEDNLKRTKKERKIITLLNALETDEARNLIRFNYTKRGEKRGKYSL